MDYRETSPSLIAHFLEWWDDYKTINSLHDRPASERFQAFKAAWCVHEPEDAGPLEAVVVPPEYTMLQDWLAASASGYWEPVDA